MDDLLDRTALNRATLHRQLLLERHPIGVVEAVEAIGGLNAQQPNDPYLALHSRLADFSLADLTQAVEDRRIVRSCLMRATQHLVSANELRRLRPVMGPLLAQAQRNAFGRRTDGVDLAELVAEAEVHLTGRTMARPDLGRLLAESRPGADSNALAWSVQYLLPLVHPAPSGTWDTLGTIPVALAHEHVGLLDPPDPRQLVRRHLAAFGPATTADIRSWSGVTGLREVVASMDGELRTFRDESGRRLYDLPDAPRPDPDTPAPVRLVAGFDNMLLAFSDRTRLMSDEVRRRVCIPDVVEPTLLVDGTVTGMWSLDRKAGTVTIQLFEKLSAASEEAATTEAAAILKLTAPEATPHEVRILPPT